MKRFALVASLLACGALVASADHHEKREKKSIKEVMKLAHKDGLLKKVLSGEAEKADKDMLLDLYVDMFESEPPKGEMESWQMLAGRSVLAAAKVAVGREGAEEELKEATNCMECHKAHKPPAN